ncbi:MAG TPA: acyl-CoA dehydrogenase family protein [Chryseolinea sp.]
MTIKHPSEFLPEAITEELRKEAFAAERISNLTATQLKIIHDQRWLNMYVPKEYGGLGLSLPEILRIEEALGWTDGSTAWVVTLCSGAAWFIGFMEEEVAKSILRTENVCFAGSGAVTGTASRTLKGFEIQGSWKYATGSAIATVFTMNCHVKENGALMYHDDGTPVIRSFVLERSEVTLYSTWSAMGMIATGSHSFDVRNVSVPFDRSFIIKGEHATIDAPIFQFPFLQLAETTLAVNLSGMTHRFFDLCASVFSSRENSLTEVSMGKLQDYRATLDEIRSSFYSKTDVAWQALISKAAISETHLNEISRLSHGLVRACRDAVNDLYPLCGLEAADLQREINRVWRNFHTAGQHALFRPHNI